MKLVLLDDSSIALWANAFILSDYFEDADIHKFEKYDEANKYLRNNANDGKQTLVLVDYWLVRNMDEEYTGFDFYRNGPKDDSIKYVLFTGTDCQGIIDEAFRLGFSDVIHKAEKRSDVIKKLKPLLKEPLERYREK